MSLICWLALAFPSWTPSDEAIRIVPKKDAMQVEVSAELPKELADKLPAGKVSQDDGEAVLPLCLVIDRKEGQPMLGSYQRDGLKLIFTPRFPLQPDKTYQATLFHADKKVGATTYKVPARPARPATEVVAVWPTGDVLPANHLRFYIQFSNPMRGGEDIFSQIRLLDSAGDEITDCWLTDELWNEDGTILTLLIHPGRIKWGVLLRILLGPVLEPDKRYTLVISDDMLDADGRKLAKEYRKQFRTTAEDRTRIDLSTWKLQAPKAGQRDAVALAFPKALDHKGLGKLLSVVDAKGKAVPGKIEVGRDGRSWKFVPETAWAAQEYSIRVDDHLEDVAGNTPVQPFDVDADAPALLPQRMVLPFRPVK